MNSSKLYDQNSFYSAFLRDIRTARRIVIIESPFITKSRITPLLPVFAKLRKRGVRIIVNTKPVDEHDNTMQAHALWCIWELQRIGVEALCTVGHHRELAIIDGSVMCEGSLNILSQYDSCEIMWRILDEA